MKKVLALVAITVPALLALGGCVPLPVADVGTVYYPYDTPYPPPRAYYYGPTYMPPPAAFSDPFFYGPYPYDPYFGGVYGAYRSAPPPVAVAPPPATHAPVSPGVPPGPRPPMNPGPVPQGQSGNSHPPMQAAPPRGEQHSPVPTSLFRRSRPQ